MIDLTKDMDNLDFPSKFLSSLTSFLQTVCHENLEFRSFVHFSGQLVMSVDGGTTYAGNGLTVDVEETISKHPDCSRSFSFSTNMCSSVLKNCDKNKSQSEVLHNRNVGHIDLWTYLGEEEVLENTDDVINRNSESFSVGPNSCSTVTSDGVEHETQCDIIDSNPVNLNIDNHVGSTVDASLPHHPPPFHQNAPHLAPPPVDFWTDDNIYLAVAGAVSDDQNINSSSDVVSKAVERDRNTLSVMKTMIMIVI